MFNRTKVIATIVALFVVFGLGFFPQWNRARALKQDLEDAHRSMEELRFQGRLAKLRETSARVTIDVANKNFGLALQKATLMFEEAGRLHRDVEDAAFRSALQEILSQRDSLTAELAQANPQVQTRCEALMMKMEQIALPATR